MENEKLHEKMRRLRLYSNGHRRYRCSRGIARPIKIVKPRSELNEFLDDYQLQNRVAYEVLAIDERGEPVAVLNEIGKELFLKKGK